MTLLPLSDEADCLVTQHENRVGFFSITPTAARSPLPRERFRSSTRFGLSRRVFVRRVSARFETVASDAITFMCSILDGT
jgi:hypothetical protein